MAASELTYMYNGAQFNVQSNTYTLIILYYLTSFSLQIILFHKM